MLIAGSNVSSARSLGQKPTIAEIEEMISSCDGGDDDDEPSDGVLNFQEFFKLMTKPTSSAAQRLLAQIQEINAGNSFMS